MTPKTRLALRILKKHGTVTARQFAFLMWPKSEGWQRVHRCGTHGSTRGTGMWLAGGSYLARLAKRKLVYREYNTNGQHVFSLSGQGIEELKENDGSLVT